MMQKPTLTIKQAREESNKINYENYGGSWPCHQKTTKKAYHVDHFQITQFEYDGISFNHDTKIKDIRYAEFE